MGIIIDKYKKLKADLLNSGEQIIYSGNGGDPTLDSKKDIYLYRGEHKDYGNTSCLATKNRDYLNDDIDKKEHEKPFSDVIDNLVNWQENGIHTRLLDVSECFKISLFFACDSKDKNDDGYVYIFPRKGLYNTDINLTRPSFDINDINTDIPNYRGVIVYDKLNLLMDVKYPDIRESDSYKKLILYKSNNERMVANKFSGDRELDNASQEEFNKAN
ncbi:FRG domain-containing protein [Fructilactobacillus myrtifloralis]|uniref:FRG domain-containing protein n=1 Tax=Fructilactobacillus myrtifloralis TaxID=2940301 RepID=A0ABY5BN76_9LACO|nr:FRG domain-containing protein [Fructilactobacillus myrtifloralis]USS85125.1 FRG domain-containing protein [Fructilactobacillus myrtifloralis]